MPLFLGTSGATTVLGPGYDKLKSHLGIQAGRGDGYRSRCNTPGWMRKSWSGWAATGGPIVPGPAESVLAKEVSDDHIIDTWGTPWRRAPDSIYFEIAGFPLRTATIDDLEKYPWPKLTSPFAVRRLGRASPGDSEGGLCDRLGGGRLRLRAGVSDARNGRGADGHGRGRRFLHRADGQAEEPAVDVRRCAAAATWARTSMCLSPETISA